MLKRLAITPNPLVSTHGESYKNFLETHFNIQRRLYDYQFAQTTTPTELEQMHQRFMRPTIRPRITGYCKEVYAPDPDAGPGRRQGAPVRARRTRAQVFPGVVSPHDQSAMAVSRCIVTISMWNCDTRSQG